MELWPQTWDVIALSAAIRANPVDVECARALTDALDEAGYRGELPTEESVELFVKMCIIDRQVATVIRWIVDEPCEKPELREAICRRNEHSFDEWTHMIVERGALPPLSRIIPGLGVSDQGIQFDVWPGVVLNPRARLLLRPVRTVTVGVLWAIRLESAQRNAERQRRRATTQDTLRLAQGLAPDFY